MASMESLGLPISSAIWYRNSFRLLICLSDQLIMNLNCRILLFKKNKVFPFDLCNESRCYVNIWGITNTRNLAIQHIHIHTCSCIALFLPHFFSSKKIHRLIMNGESDTKEALNLETKRRGVLISWVRNKLCLKHRVIQGYKRINYLFEESLFWNWIINLFAQQSSCHFSLTSPKLTSKQMFKGRLQAKGRVIRTL